MEKVGRALSNVGASLADARHHAKAALRRQSSVFAQRRSRLSRRGARAICRGRVAMPRFSAEVADVPV